MKKITFSLFTLLVLLVGPAAEAARPKWISVTGTVEKMGAKWVQLRTTSGSIRVPSARVSEKNRLKIGEAAYAYVTLRQIAELN